MADTQRKLKVATAWLDGCSGCHMSLLDMDERLVELAPLIDIVYSPIVDSKVIPDGLDLAIIEGAVSNEDDLHRATRLREAAKFVISLGDCAITGNVPSMRNAIPVGAIINRQYHELADAQPQDPDTSHGVLALLPQALPVHQVIEVDLFVQGCPPNADTIHFVLSELIAGRTPDPTTLTRFGA